ncbi:hypothetical protein [Pseudomonas fluorescens]|uniref:hypothetical protein n=1 Tax=Pseudomonas fluorescens TaxID=294 RepID=UPI0026D5DE84
MPPIAVGQAQMHQLTLPHRGQAPSHIGHKAYAQLDQILTSQAYMMSTVDYFTLLGWMFMGLMLLVWLAKPPFTAKAGPAASGH